jgi:predicted DsbA family dithiol-disulfide isomerase
VREVHPAVFPAFDLALFEAFFGRTEDISDPEVLVRLGEAAGLNPSRLRAALRSGEYHRAVLREHLEATSQGIHGIPAIQIPGQAPIVGAVPYVDLRRAVDRALTGGRPGSDGDPAPDARIIPEDNAFS